MGFIILKQEVNMSTNQIMKRSNGTVFPGRNMTSWVDQILQDNLSRFFNDDFFTSGSKTNFQVPVNFRETDQSFEMELVAPGLKKEDFKINVSGDLLSVSYESAEEQNEKKENDEWLRREYAVQTFSRSFKLDDTVDMQHIRASYKDGILYLSLPKQEKARKISKSIEVQ
jgi:HSP20 family protein